MDNKKVSYNFAASFDNDVCKHRYQIAKLNKIIDMATKKKKLDVVGTLRALKPGDTITFVIAGAGVETTYNSLRAIKSKYQLKVSVLSIDNGLRAQVTAL